MFLHYNTIFYSFKYVRADYCDSIVISVAPSPAGNLFATGSGDMRARIWRLVINSMLFHSIEADITFFPTATDRIADETMEEAMAGARGEYWLAFSEDWREEYLAYHVVVRRIFLSYFVCCARIRTSYIGAPGFSQSVPHILVEKYQSNMKSDSDWASFQISRWRSKLPGREVG